MKYEIKGGNLPVVICDLESGEKMFNESGSMCWMSPNMKMDTTTGGGIGKGIARMFSGESMFQNVYTSEGGPGLIAFASSFPGDIKAVELSGGRSIIVQKSAFLAATMGIKMETFFQKKLGSGLVGGEGFIMQKISGEGTVFLEIDGSVVDYDLAAGQKMVIDTGYLAMMDDTCSLDVQTIKGVKNVLFGGEGLFNTVVTGPGHIMLQTMPASGFAQAIIPYLPVRSN